ncbi:hypothetical protein BpHYR1_021990 [Brachionus plicatilis]|uniref:Uncharacterized protein n=1 Tax=Brachionus plicatilis TaxID=10195 RepID=A0A3M7QT91_BRAPC|nr:hypothetical protein BpHYR1_021990 [Brachionus plicatilis]
MLEININRANAFFINLKLNGNIPLDSVNSPGALSDTASNLKKLTRNWKIYKILPSKYSIILLKAFNAYHYLLILNLPLKFDLICIQNYKF